MTCFNDDWHYVATSSAVVVVLAYLTSLKWGNSTSWFQVVFAALFAILAATFLTYFQPDIFPPGIVPGTALHAGVFLIYYVAASTQNRILLMGSVFLIIVPVVFHNQLVVSEFLQEHVSQNLPDNTGLYVFILLAVIFVALLYLSGVKTLVLAATAVLVSALLVVVAICINIIEHFHDPVDDGEGGLTRTRICCFSATPVGRCPLDLGGTIGAVTIFIGCLLVAIGAFVWLRKKKTKVRFSKLKTIEN